MKRLATLTLLAVVTALEVLIGALASGCTSIEPQRTPQSAMVVADGRPGVE